MINVRHPIRKWEHWWSAVTRQNRSAEDGDGRISELCDRIGNKCYKYTDHYTFWPHITPMLPVLSMKRADMRGEREINNWMNFIITIRTWKTVITMIILSSKYCSCVKSDPCPSLYSCTVVPNPLLHWNVFLWSHCTLWASHNVHQKLHQWAHPTFWLEDVQYHLPTHVIAHSCRCRSVSPMRHSKNPATTEMTSRDRGTMVFVVSQQLQLEVFDPVLSLYMRYRPCFSQCVLEST